MDGRPVVGIVGTVDGSVRPAVEAAGAAPTPGTATEVVGNCDYLVTVGKAALLAVARAGPDVPVLPVGEGRAFGAVPRADAPRAVERLLDGEFDTGDYPLLDVQVGDRTRARVAMDATLVTADPGEISEYALHLDGRRLSRFRADGVVVATPAGSGGYARRAGGPLVHPHSPVATVVPVAPFATDPSHWTLPLSGVVLSVERDETPIHLLADDRAVGTVYPDERVRLVREGSLAVVSVPESRSPLAE